MPTASKTSKHVSGGIATSLNNKINATIGATGDAAKLLSPVQDSASKHQPTAAMKQLNTVHMKGRSEIV